MINTGMKIGGFEIYGICNEYCIAKSTSPDRADLYIVYKIDSQNFAHADKYFTSKEDAEKEFARNVFAWFK